MRDRVRILWGKKQRNLRHLKFKLVKVKVKINQIKIKI